MERRDTTKWLNDIKVAVINRDLEKLSQIVQEEVPKFDTLEEMKEAQSFVNMAMAIFEEEQARIAKFLSEYRKLKNYESNSYSYQTEWVG